MKIPISISQPFQPRGIYPSLIELLQRAKSKSLKIYRTLFANENGGGDPPTERPSVSKVEVVVKPRPAVPALKMTDITLHTNSGTFKSPHFVGTIKLVIPGKVNHVLIGKQTLEPNAKKVIFRSDGKAFNNPDSNTAKIYWSETDVEDVNNFTYQDTTGEK